MATIELRLSTKIDKQTGKSEIILRFFHGKVIDHNAKTGVYILPKYWNDKKQEITIKDRLVTDETKYHTEAKDRLESLCNEVSTHFTNADKKTISKDWLKDTVDEIRFPEKYITVVEEVKPLTLFEYISDFIVKAPQRKDKATGRTLAYNNIQQYKATEKHLHLYAKTKRKKDFELSEINQKFYDGFVSYLQNEIIEKDNIIKQAFTANSVGKHVRILKLMLNEATAEKVNILTDYEKFHVFTEDTDTVYLNETELQTLKDTDFSKTPYLDRTRDWFLLLAWTGCRFSDLEKIGKTDIKDGFITFRQQKTNNKVTIPLHPIVLEILEKYEYNLPEAISNQRFNEYVKEVAERAGIDSIETTTRTVGGKLQTESYPKYKLISSHTGRRSFCTNMYKRGLPCLMIMSISGHKTEKSFLKYIKVTQKEHADMMKAAWANIYQEGGSK